MTYTGSCHCGQVAFEADGEIDEVMSCNCSICRRKGALLWFVPRQSLRLLTPPENLRTYTFNRKLIQHRFCPNCGVQPFGEFVAPDGRELVAINVRCIDEVDLDQLKLRHFDGLSM